jgi:hypothetical protein
VEFNDFRSEKTKDYWTYLEDNYKEVSTWPKWMRGEAGSSCQRSKSEESGCGKTDESNEIVELNDSDQSSESD